MESDEPYVKAVSNILLHFRKSCKLCVAKKRYDLLKKKTEK